MLDTDQFLCQSRKAANTVQLCIALCGLDNLLRNKKRTVVQLTNWLKEGVSRAAWQNGEHKVAVVQPGDDQS